MGFIIIGIAFASDNVEAQHSAGAALACIGIIRALLYMTTKNEN